MGGKDKQIKKSNKGNKNVINTSSNQNADSLETITLQNSQDIVFDNAVGNESNVNTPVVFSGIKQA